MNNAALTLRNAELRREVGSLKREVSSRDRLIADLTAEGAMLRDELARGITFRYNRQAMIHKGIQRVAQVAEAMRPWRRLATAWISHRRAWSVVCPKELSAILDQIVLGDSDRPEDEEDHELARLQRLLRLSGIAAEGGEGEES